MDKLLNSTVLNFNYSACLKEAHYVGNTTFYNVCTDTHSVVPWGGMDWMGSILGMAFGGLVAVLVVGAVVGFVTMVIKETYASV
jgi:hypothetical protein